MILRGPGAGIVFNFHPILEMQWNGDVGKAIFNGKAGAQKHGLDPAEILREAKLMRRRPHGPDKRAKFV